MREGDETFLRHTYALRQAVRDKWTPAVLVALADGPLRRSEILTVLNSFPATPEEWPSKKFTLHDSILARVLRKLVNQGMLERRSDGEVFPPRVFYGLTAAGREYLELERTLARWARDHVADIGSTDHGNRSRQPDDGAAAG